VASCSVLLALIGLHWLESRDDSGARRLDCPGDLVRIELAAALRGTTPVVPVLVRGSSMPRQIPQSCRAQGIKPGKTFRVSIVGGRRLDYYDKTCSNEPLGHPGGNSGVGES
jgi:hypothetical protein